MSLVIMELKNDDFTFIGPFTKYIARRMQKPCDEPGVTVRLKLRNKHALSYRSPQKLYVKRRALSPDSRQRSTTPTCSSHTPVQRKNSASPVSAKSKFSDHQSFSDLMTETNFAAGCLLVRPSPILTRPGHVSIMRPLTPLSRLIEPHRKRPEPEEPRYRATSVRKETKVSVKDAMRDREWLLKAREGVIANFNALVLQSNGVKLDCSLDQLTGYRFYVGKGNNSALVRSILANRWWWNRVDEEEKLSANFVWTQWLDMDSLEQSEPLQLTADLASASPAPTSLSTTVRYNPTNGPYRQLPMGKLVDLTPLNYDLIFQSSSFAKHKSTLKFTSFTLKTCNKLQYHHHLSNKKALFVNMRMYYDLQGLNPYHFLPITFHIKSTENDEDFNQFLSTFHEFAKNSETRNIWILKPGENTNRGSGITLCDSISQIKQEISSFDGEIHTFILQKYIENPFLINKRKFDIRLYALITSVNGVIQGYFYSEGYLRTSSKEFSLKDIENRLVHLTNDAVQKYAEDYGKFEQGNKLSYADFQRYLDGNYASLRVNFGGEVVPKMKAIVKDTVQAVYRKVDRRQRRYTFEVGGT